MPSFPVVHANQGLGQMPQANADWQKAVSGLFDAYTEGQQYGQVRKIQEGRLALLGQGGPMAPGGRPDYPASFSTLLGLGDVQGARAVSDFAQNEENAAWRRQEASRAQANSDRTYDLAAGRAGGVGGTKYSVQPVYGQDADGNPVMLQPGTDGTVKQSQMPPGVVLSGKPILVDAGTHTIVLDPITRQPVNVIPKNVAGVAAAKAEGTAQGTAAASLPDTIAAAGNTLSAINAIKTDPAMYWGTGATSFMGTVPGTPEYDFAQRVDQLKGQTFLQAYNMLRGGGAITDIEGEKATAALGRLNRAQSPKAFNEALDELAGVVTAGLERAKTKAKGQPQAKQDPYSTGANAGTYVPPVAGPNGSKSPSQFAAPPTGAPYPSLETGAAGRAPQQGSQGAAPPRQAPDGNWYVPDPNRPGKFLKVTN